MIALSTPTRAQLAKILALLGSNDLATIAEAAAAAHQIVQESGLSWRQILKPPPIEKRLPEMGVWRQTVILCQAHPGALRQWEAGFLSDLPRFRRLSVKQRYVLKQIADRVLGAERASRKQKS